MAQMMPLGVSDFKEVRRKGSFYVDKTRLISDLIEDHSKVILLPRPRRFGKTLNLTMLREFFDDQADNRALFEGLAVTEDANAMVQLGAFPVIYVTFKDLKPLSWPSCQRKLILLVGEMFKDHRQRLLSAQLYQDELDLIHRFISDQADLEMCQNGLAILCKLLHRVSGKPAVLLIDEYDSPIHAGFQYGFRTEVVAFMRDFLSAGLKDNPYLEKGVLTGILRVAKDSIFSGLNNPSVYTILDRRFSSYFGFTQEEVQRILADAGMADREQEVQTWYNGYRFGTQTIYNPWSILSVLRDPEAPFVAHWIHTADNRLIHDLIVQEQALTLGDLTTLLAGDSVSCVIEPYIAFNDLKPASVWGLMLQSGYLTLADEQPDQPTYYWLRIPNLEVRSFFASTVNHWLGQPTHVTALLDSLLREDLSRFEELLTETVIQVLSYHDTGGRDCERVYHAFLAGLMVNLGSHQVISNRESGHGRFDLALVPKQQGQVGFLFEFKRGEPEQLEALAQEALAQIEQHDYPALFRQQGIARVRKIGLAFCGKRVALASSVVEIASVQLQPLPGARSMREGRPPRQGDVLLARFALEEQLSSGGFASVWRAFDHSLNRQVALKLLHRQYSEDLSRRERFFRGARITQSLRHECIVAIFERECRDGDQFFYVMEYLPGGDLETAVLEGKVPRETWLPVLLQAGAALQFAHERGVTHRNIKPSKILLSLDRQARLTSFDLVRDFDTTKGTRDGLGSFIFAAPECLNGGVADIRSDVFGLGMTFVFAMAGKKLPIEVMRNPKGYIEALALPLPLAEVLTRAVAWNPEERIATVAQLCHEVQSALT